MNRFQCYDCGSMVSQSDLCRREIEVGSGAGPGGVVTIKEKVNLCESCNRSRSRTSWIGFAFWLVVGLVVLGIGAAAEK